MLSINTNLSSLIAQTSLKNSTNILNQAVERMTTGYKINHASDNAANYSIATNMTTKIGAYQVAEDNALQGLEMMSTSLESLNQISDKLNRMRALAVQSQNGTYGAQSLSAIKAEANALLDEITRINNSAEFNGIKLFSTGKMDVTNAGKELELNEQGFLQEVVKVDTTSMTKLSSVDPNATLAVGEYSISTPEELAKLATMTNAGLVEAGSTFTLANDIDLSAYTSGTGWMSIGIENNTINNPFSGTFNGNGYTIKNLYIKSSSAYEARGFFGTVNNSTILNLKIKDAYVESGGAAGILVANTQGSVCTIKNCSVSGTVVGNNQFNGRTAAIAGYARSSSIYDCYANANISSKGGTVGGIAGEGVIYNSFFEGNVTGEKGSVGGIVGYGNATDCKCIANVTAPDTVGGIIGSMHSGEVKNCYFSGRVSGQMYVSGICGQSSYGSGTVTNSIVEASIVADSEYGIFWGKSSNGNVTLKDSFYYSGNTGNIDLTATNSNVQVNNVIDISVPCDYTLQVGSCGDDARSTLSYTTYIDFGELNNVLSSGIESAGTIEKIDNLVNIVAMKQTELGTGINRLESVLEEISTQYENLVSSRSTLRDADIAKVSADYIRQQILQQASATLMATANQSPAIALQLI